MLLITDTKSGRPSYLELLIKVEGTLQGPADDLDANSSRNSGLIYLSKLYAPVVLQPTLRSNMEKEMKRIARGALQRSVLLFYDPMGSSPL